MNARLKLNVLEATRLTREGRLEEAMAVLRGERALAPSPHTDAPGEAEFRLRARAWLADSLPRLPWPEPPDFSKLEQLTFFNWRGNVLLLEQIPCFPALEKAEFQHGYGTGTPLRDFQKLRGIKI